MAPTSSARVSTSKIAASTSERLHGARASGSMSGRNILGGRGCRRIRLFPESLVRAALDRGLEFPQVLVQDAAEADGRLTSSRGLLTDQLQHFRATMKPRPPDSLQSDRGPRDSQR